ncbi:hypothetical protein GYMLUDRAFT_937641 [Collybiopsis luxurians FD-317 M1]|uniref:Uncharacterized protein n=1 Tax=Collybiopsis luxurians FD-317 M1 TaxID=944289 RepID=A0A0D0C642_9AGAR|nr:hypothetical protein GYMLUDRAFT_937641 [Collybiopsis luxurians FD-317 M1]
MSCILIWAGSFGHISSYGLLSLEPLSNLLIARLFIENQFFLPILHTQSDRPIKADKPERSSVGYPTARFAQMLPMTDFDLALGRRCVMVREEGDLRKYALLPLILPCTLHVAFSSSVLAVLYSLHPLISIFLQVLLLNTLCTIIALSIVMLIVICSLFLSRSPRSILLILDRSHTYDPLSSYI